MRTVFVDTSYLLALTLRRDEHHAQALAIEQAFAGRLVTTEFVLIEYHDAMCQAAFRSAAHAMCDRLVQDVCARVVPATTELVERGRKLYISRPDKDWSLTDCISFVVMREHGLTEALTADHHFEQAGFKAMLRE